MLNKPYWVVLAVGAMFVTPPLMGQSTAVDTTNWVSQSDDDSDKKKAKEKVNLGRQLMKTRALPKNFPKSNRPKVGTSAQMQRAAESAARASKAAVKEEEKSRSPAAEARKYARPPKPVKSQQAGAEIDYKERAKKGRFSFEFSKAEIMDIVKAISDMTRKNFIIPETLKSQKITILSPTKITAAEAYQVFLSALSINGITVVRVGKFYKLIESKNAIKKPIPTCVGPDDICPAFNEQMITMLITLMHTEANQISSVLKSLVSKEGELTVFQPSNALILSEYAPNITRIKRIIKALDQPGFDDELRIVQIEYATAQEVADKITQVFDVAAAGKTSAKSSRKSPSKSESLAGRNSGDDGLVQISKIIADERTNQIIIKANKRSFESIRRLIAKLDVPISEAEQGRIHVYYLENAKAEDLASTLSSLTQGNSSSKAGRGSKKGKASAQQSAQLFEGEIKVTADKSTNSLIVVASAHDYRALKKLVERLDKVRPQVYIEAAILEVTNSNDHDLGISWHTPVQFGANDLGGYGDGSMGFVQSGPWSGGAEGISGTLSPAGLLGMAGGSVAGIVGKSFTVPGTEFTIPSFGMILKWLEVDSNAQVLSTPHILTTDNEEATIEVGKKIPFRRGSSMGSSALAGALGGAGGAGGLAGLSSSLGALGGGMFSSVDRIDVSLKLSITPQINESNRIRLEVDQKIEDVTGIDKTTETPLTSNRSIKSVVVVEDQQTIVLGGLMRDNVTEGESKVPLLGDLPVVGWMFKTRTKKVEKVNLLLVLTPYIVRGVEDFQAILERKMEEHEEFSADYYGGQSDYRVHIDYRRKMGPLAKLGQVVEREYNRIENGGDGGSDEVLITPEEPAAEPTPTQFQTLSGEESAEAAADTNTATPEVPKE